MISEGSRDTEDWSNDENADLITEISYILLYVHKQKLQYFTVCCGNCV